MTVTYATRKFLLNRDKVELAARRTLTKGQFEALATQVVLSAQYQGTSSTFADRYLYIGKVAGVWWTVVVLKANRSVGISLFAHDIQTDAFAASKARRHTV